MACREGCPSGSGASKPTEKYTTGLALSGGGIRSASLCLGVMQALADARDDHRPPALAGPGLADADPARAVLVALAVAVPVELDLDAAVLVRIDLLARRTGDDRGLRSLDDGLGGDARRAVGFPAGQHAEAHGEGGVATARAARTVSPGLIVLAVQRVVGLLHQVFLVLVVAGMLLQREQKARRDPADIPLGLHQRMAGL